ncbi:ras-related protein Rab-39A-like [Amblyraja radiata]|uniref:ras-related protein Rab-39A-like n=1 Tax=Amblyraja radiata TaxID=386614 RepID=UPI001401E4ED|nr:ras-related protein Rab-39A-like [Amblyraja radiata]
MGQTLPTLGAVSKLGNKRTNLEKVICQFRVILVGESGVGKTAIVHRLTEGVFKEELQKTIGVDYYIHMLETPAIYRVKLQVWDTAGEKELGTITQSHLQIMLGGLLVFDITNRHSLDYIRSWLDECGDVFDQGQCVFLLVGHKCDLSAERTVPKEEAEQVAADLGMGYIETSAKDDTNIQGAFHTLASSIAELVKSEVDAGISETQRLVLLNR